MWKTYASIIYVMMMGLAVISTDPAVQSVGVSTTQALAPFMGTLSRPHQTQGIGLDLPAITYAYGQTKTSFADSLNNLTLTPLSIGGVPLTISTFQNSTTADYRFSALVGANLVSGDMFWTTQGFNNLMIIKGTISGILASPLPLVFTLSGGALSFSNGGTSVSQGHLSFDWSADSGLATWNNATKQLTFTLSSNFNIDPLAADNVSDRQCTAVTSCASATIAEGLNDVLIVFCSAAETSDTLSISTSTPSATWTKRKATTQTLLTVDEFYTVAGSSAQWTVTCATSGVALNMAQKFFGISGANPGDCGSGGVQCFDTNGAVPCSNTATAATSPKVLSCTLSTSNPNDFIYGGWGTTLGQSSSFTVGSGFTALGSVSSGHAPFAEYQIVSATQTNLAVSGQLSFTGTDNINMIGDAVIANSCCTSTTSTTTSTTTTTTTTFSSTTVKTSGPGDLWVVTIPVFFAILLIIGIRRRR